MNIIHHTQNWLQMLNIHPVSISIIFYTFEPLATLKSILCCQLKRPLGRGQLEGLLVLQLGQLTPRVQLDDAARSLHVLVGTIVLELGAIKDKPSPGEPLLVIRTHLVKVALLLTGL